MYGPSTFSDAVAKLNLGTPMPGTIPKTKPTASVSEFSAAIGATDLREYAESILSAAGPTGSLVGATNSTEKSDTTTSKKTDISNVEQYMGEGIQYPKFIRISSSQSPYISLGHLYTLVNVLFLYTETKDEFIKNIQSLQKASDGVFKKSDYIKRNKPYIELELYSIFKNQLVLRSFAPQKVLIFNKYAEHLYDAVQNEAPPVDSKNTKKLTTEDLKNATIVSPKNNAKFSGKNWTLTPVDANAGQSKLYKEVKDKYVHVDAEFDKKTLADIHASWPELSTNYQYGSIKRIFINIDVVIKLLETSDLYAFLDAIHDTINSSVSDYFKLIRDADDFSPKAIKVVDSSIVAAKKEYTFSIYDKNTAVKNISLQSKLPKDFQSVAYVANTAANPMQRDANLRDAFSSISGEYVDKDGENNNYNSNSERGYSDAATDPDAQTAVVSVLSKRLDDATVSEHEKLFIHAIKHRELKLIFGYAAAEVGEVIVRDNEAVGFPVNVQLSLDLDGIGGIYYGNVFGISYGPSFIVNNVLFQATNVEHEVSIDSGWTTRINGIIRAITPAKGK